LKVVKNLRWFLQRLCQWPRPWKWTPWWKLSPFPRWVLEHVIQQVLFPQFPLMAGKALAVCMKQKWIQWVELLRKTGPATTKPLDYLFMCLGSKMRKGIKFIIFFSTLWTFICKEFILNSSTTCWLFLLSFLSSCVGSKLN